MGSGTASPRYTARDPSVATATTTCAPGPPSRFRPTLPRFISHRVSTSSASSSASAVINPLWSRRSTCRRGKGALLRREGLYSSLVSEWRRQRDRGGMQALAPAACLLVPAPGRPRVDPLPRESATRRRARQGTQGDPRPGGTLRALRGARASERGARERVEQLMDEAINSPPPAGHQGGLCRGGQGQSHPLPPPPEPAFRLLPSSVRIVLTCALSEAERQDVLEVLHSERELPPNGRKHRAIWGSEIDPSRPGSAVSQGRLQCADGHRDGHPRSHGLIASVRGWRLSPAVDLNPVRTSAITLRP